MNKISIMLFLSLFIIPNIIADDSQTQIPAYGDDELMALISYGDDQESIYSSYVQNEQFTGGSQIIDRYTNITFRIIDTKIYHYGLLYNLLGIDKTLDIDTSIYIHDATFHRYSFVTFENIDDNNQTFALASLDEFYYDTPINHTIEIERYVPGGKLTLYMNYKTDTQDVTLSDSVEILDYSILIIILIILLFLASIIFIYRFLLHS